MSPRTRQTFAKRQKEMARQEKQRAKAARRQQRKLENQEPGNRPEQDVPASPFSIAATEEHNPDPFKERL